MGSEAGRVFKACAWALCGVWEFMEGEGSTGFCGRFKVLRVFEGGRAYVGMRVDGF